MNSKKNLRRNRVLFEKEQLEIYLSYNSNAQITKYSNIPFNEEESDSNKNIKEIVQARDEFNKKSDDLRNEFKEQLDEKVTKKHKAQLRYLTGQIILCLLVLIICASPFIKQESLKQASLPTNPIKTKKLAGYNAKR